MRAADEFWIENRLREDTTLHGLMKGSLFALDRMLQAYATRFPSFTDHSLLHSMNVLRYCNEILGGDGVNAMNAGECYVLVMSCYLHDIGMAIGDRDYAALVDDIVPRGWWDAHPDAGESDVVRAFHHEFSGRLIVKYAALFEIPEAYVFPIVQVSRGHRKTDLTDSAEYPTLPSAQGPLRLGALGAVLRLADELDWDASRNPELLFYDVEMRTQKDREIFGIHASIRSIRVDADIIRLMVKPSAPEYAPLVASLADKIEETRAYCSSVAAHAGGPRITQARVETVWLHEDGETA